MTATQDRDAQLLLAIAERQDRDAFGELFDRFQRPAYSLAQYLTRDRDLAEEAVQEAFLRVWRSAKTFRADGKPRSWVLRIVAGKSLEILRRKRRNREKMERVQQQAASCAEAPLAAGAEQGELLVTLRRHLDRLPDLERQLIALYYGGEMSQDEIAAQLEMPQRTVSFRIQKILEQLRERLSTAGFAAALPLAGGTLSGDLLSEALCSGPSVPPGLGEALTAKLGTAAAEVSQRAAVAKASLSPLAWAAVAVTVAAAGAGAYLMLNKEAPSEASASAANTDAPARETKPAQDKPFSVNWSFAKGAPKELSVIMGQWTWREGFDGVGEMHMALRESSGDNRRDVFAILPMKIPARPFRMDIKVGASRTEAHGMDLLWISKDGVLPFTRHGTVYSLLENRNALQIDVVGEWVIYHINGIPYAAHQYAKAYPADRMGLLITTYDVREIAIRELAPDDPVLRAFDADKVIKELRRNKKTYELKQLPLRPMEWSLVPEEYR
ncbi:MAG: sigma-70 family RNA polymerase sigma factor [Planctomycetes bacterium]|nr:sigma-70 family RNA polymerase sigma factor [Planctomycetota bacterium]